MGTWCVCGGTKGPSHLCFLHLTLQSSDLGGGGLRKWPLEGWSKETGSRDWLGLWPKIWALGWVLISWLPWGSSVPCDYDEHLETTALNSPLTGRTLKWCSLCLKFWHFLYRGCLALILILSVITLKYLSGLLKFWQPLKFCLWGSHFPAYSSCGLALWPWKDYLLCSLSVKGESSHQSQVICRFKQEIPMIY